MILAFTLILFVSQNRQEPCSRGHPRTTCHTADEHRKNNPINQRLLSQFTIDEFDQQCREIAPRIIYLVATNEYPNVEYWLLTRRGFNYEYCQKIIQALGWTVGMSNQQVVKNCESNIGAHFSSRPEPVTLANIAPSKISRQYEYFGKYGPIIKKIETTDYDVSAECLQMLAEDKFIEPMLDILDLWSINFDALTMSKYIVLLTWFGKQMNFILKGFASAVVKMEFKHSLQVCLLVFWIQLLVL